MFGWLKKKSPAPNGPDFSDIDSREKAEALFRRGDLEKLFLMPLEFGGEDIPVNTLYVPVGLADIKAGVDNNVIGPLAAEGRITNTPLPQSIRAIASSRSPSRSSQLSPANSCTN